MFQKIYLFIYLTLLQAVSMHKESQRNLKNVAASRLLHEFNQKLINFMTNYQAAKFNPQSCIFCDPWIMPDTQNFSVAFFQIFNTISCRFSCITIFFIACDLQWQCYIYINISLHGHQQQIFLGQRVTFLLLFCWFLLDSYAHTYLMLIVSKNKSHLG